MMLGLERETVIFFYAVLAGVVARCVYGILCLIRRLIPHSNWLINLEDFIYWISMSIYIFAQIFITTYGSIRWFFLLGLVCGALCEWSAERRVKKVLDKIKKRT